MYQRTNFAKLTIYDIYDGGFMNNVEVGVVTGHPLKQMYLQTRTILVTWIECKKKGLPCDKWYGVYPVGSEKILAQTGCMPGSEAMAKMIADKLNT